MRERQRGRKGGKRRGTGQERGGGIEVKGEAGRPGKKGGGSE